MGRHRGVFVGNNYFHSHFVTDGHSGLTDISVQVIDYRHDRSYSKRKLFGFINFIEDIYIYPYYCN